jgi:hypothetical protein
MQLDIAYIGVYTRDGQNISEEILFYLPWNATRRLLIRRAEGASVIVDFECHAADNAIEVRAVWMLIVNGMLWRVRRTINLPSATRKPRNSQCRQ